MSDVPTDWRKHLWFLRSRKAQIALAALIVAIAAQYGLDLSEAKVLGIIAVAASLILGIALEDAATKRAAAQPLDQLREFVSGKNDRPSGNGN